MVIDSSAIIAILKKEAEYIPFQSAMNQADVCLLSAATLLEISIVVQSHRGEEGILELDLFIHKAGIEIIPFDEEQAGIARRAFRKYGKGRHPAGLNFGDCFSYALSMVTGEPLLFKGNDFSLTDITPAVRT